MKLSSFGCNQVSHLIGRLNSTMPPGVSIEMDSAGMSIEDACVEIEELGITVSDCHTSLRAGVCDTTPPTHHVQLWFRSTVQPKCRASFNVSPETYTATINDFESSGLWEYNGESPVYNTGALS